MNDEQNRALTFQKHVCEDRRLPRKEIIKKGARITQIIQTGKRWQGKSFNIYYIKAQARQVAFTVPRRLGNAVKRNRAKRLLREIYRCNKCMVGAYALILIPKQTILKRSFQAIEQDFLLFLHHTEIGII